MPLEWEKSLQQIWPKVSNIYRTYTVRENRLRSKAKEFKSQPCHFIFCLCDPEKMTLT